MDLLRAAAVVPHFSTQVRVQQQAVLVQVVAVMVVQVILQPILVMELTGFMLRVQAAVEAVEILLELLRQATAARA